MGLNHTGTKLLLYAKNKGVNFESTVCIGRQGLHLDAKTFQKNLDDFGFSAVSARSLMEEGKGFSEPFLRLLGATVTDSVDASVYESATIIHDMNNPIQDIHKNKYSVVIDGGSLEHIFNFPVSIRNCMEMVKEGGHFLGITPANNFFGHGFYQFSAELYFRVFSPENGFEIEQMLFYIDQKNSVWYDVSDPNEVKSRVTLCNNYPSYLFVVARKISSKPVFSVTPQQSDYQHLMWKGEGNIDQARKNQISSPLYTKAVSKARQIFQRFRELGDGDERFFKKLKR